YWQGPLKLIAGPERIETAWWDGQWFARDYFIASDEQAALYWIYRSRQDASGQARLQWFIQGCFG
ncbi:MAG: DNA polymerase Y family protein, partial [Betaproteobacteria bacterium]|nr:DNA polymerase Y family protein [Betaproteobacteria bacterium]